MAALLRSSGEDRAKSFVKDFLFVQLIDKDAFEIWNPQNPYDYLTNILKEKGITEIEPRLCNQSAINTILANYQVGLYSNKKLLGIGELFLISFFLVVINNYLIGFFYIGWGESIEIAKETAALDAIKRLHK